jgi:hypothetical protein
MDENLNVNRDWVDDRLAELGVPAGWEPDPARAFERLRYRDGLKSRPRGWAWLAASAAAASLVVLALPTIGNVARFVGQEPPAPGASGGLTSFASVDDRPAAVFEGDTALLRPQGYREWVFVGSSLGLGYAETLREAGDPEDDLFHNVYINPASYREYSSTGEFPDGTVMILELVTSEVKNEPGLQGMYESRYVALEASVKDTERFEEGWAYYSFTERDGRLKEKAEPFGRESCWDCHNEHAETDMVFTQFYPVLRAAGSE